MLGDEKFNNLEYLTNLKVQKKQQIMNENDQKNFEDNNSNKMNIIMNIIILNLK